MKSTHQYKQVQHLGRIFELFSILESIRKIQEDSRRFEKIKGYSKSKLKSQQVKGQYQQVKVKVKKGVQVILGFFCIFLVNARLIRNFLYFLFLDYT